MSKVDLTGKTAVITGGSRGIGRAVALAFAVRGAQVMVNARGYAGLRDVVGEIADHGGEADMYAGDIGDPEAMTGLASFAHERFGGLDIVVHNGAVLGPRADLENYPIEEWQRVIAINVNGVFALTQAAIPLLRARGGGSMIYVSSGVGRHGKAGWGAYSASKFAVEGLAQIMAEEGVADGIRANCVNPGKTRTDMRASAFPREDPSTLPPPEKIVPVFLYLAGDDSKGVTGESFDAQDYMGKHY